MKPGSLSFLEPSGPVQACNGTALLLFILLILLLVLLFPLTGLQHVGLNCLPELPARK